MYFPSPFFIFFFRFEQYVSPVVTEKWKELVSPSSSQFKRSTTHYFASWVFQVQILIYYIILFGYEYGLNTEEQNK